MRSLILPAVCCLTLSSMQWVALPALAAELPNFETRTIDPEVGKVCYAVTTTDVDGDGKRDIVAVTENRVLWYRNPDWKLHVIIEDQTERDNVCIAAQDIDGDGKIDFALGAGWTKIGTLQWLTRRSSLDEKWRVQLIGQEGWTHRMGWGDVLGTGKPQLVVSPLNKTVAPGGVRLLAFEIPARPGQDPWKSTVLDEQLNAMHNHWVGDFDGDGRADILTASQEGVHLLQPQAGGTVRKTQLAAGAPGELKAQVSGAGEIKVGRGPGQQRFIVTVEPMHGTQISVYTEPTDKNRTLWTRHVLDDTLTRGHALGVADLDRDGLDEIILGHSDKGRGDPAGPGVFIYRAATMTGPWQKHIVDDGGVATEDLVIDDINQDGWPDIIAGGRATHNVKLYINQGQSAAK